MLSQLQSFFNRQSITDTVRTHRFSHLENTDVGVLRDVYYADLYQDLFKKGLLNDPNSVSFAMNTDGVAIFKSSNVSMWPVYLLVNELPIRERKAKENMLIMAFGLQGKSL